MNNPTQQQQHPPSKGHRKTMTSNNNNKQLRPLAERIANGVAETKGYNGAALAPWRTGKRRVKSLYKKNGQLTWTDESGCSEKAKGLPATVTNVDNNGDLRTERTEDDKKQAQLDARYQMGLEPATEVAPIGDYQYTQRGMYYAENLDRYLPNWVEYSATTDVEWVSCDGQMVAKPETTTPHKYVQPMHDPRTEEVVMKLGQVSIEQVRRMQTGRRLPHIEKPVAVVVNHTKDKSYQHGPLHNEPKPGHDWMSVMGTTGQSMAQTHKASTERLMGSMALSLESLAELAMDEAWETEGDELNTDDLMATYGDYEAYDYEAPESMDDGEEWLDWAKENTKPASWEACLLWAHGKTLSEVGMVQGVSKATAQSRVERTLARLQEKCIRSGKE